MPLSSAALNAQISWQLSKTNSPFQPTRQGQDSVQFSFTPLPAGINEVYVGQLSLGASANADVDFHSFTTLVGEAVTITKAYGLIVSIDPSGSDAGGIGTIAPGTATPLTWFFGGTSPTISIPSQGVLLLAQTVAQTVDNTHKKLNFANTGTGTLLINLALLCGT